MTIEQKPKLLRLDLQTFAEPNPAEPTPTPEPEPAPTPAEPQYTQADIDRIVGERLAREKAKTDKVIAEAQAEAERKKLEEASEFKALYEAEKLAREQVEEASRKSALEAKKQALLIGAGYTAEKLTYAMKHITVDDADELEAKIEELILFAPPTPAYVDPAAGGGRRQNPPKQDDGYEAARERARKLLKRK